jgi:hypothetical protein
MTGRSGPIWTQVPVESTVLSNKDIKFENTGIIIIDTPRKSVSLELVTQISARTRKSHRSK